MRRAFGAHLGEHAAHDDVARGELGLGVDGRHEALAGGVAQQGALAAQRLGDQRRRRAAGGEAGRMELDELEVADGGAGAVGHGHAVAGGHLGVGRARVDLSGPAGGEDRDHRQVQRVLAVGQVERQGADAAAVDREQVDDELVLVELHAAAHPGRLGQRARDLATGRVAAGVEHAPHRVRALPAEHDLAVLAVEPRADLDELADAVGALVDQHPHGLGSHRPAPASTVSWKCSSGESDSPRAAAMPPWARKVVVSFRRGLGEQPDAPATGGGDRGGQPGDAAAEHEDVELAAQQRTRRQADDVGARHGGHLWDGRPGRPVVGSSMRSMSISPPRRTV